MGAFEDEDLVAGSVYNLQQFWEPVTLTCSNAYHFLRNLTNFCCIFLTSLFLPVGGKNKKTQRSKKLDFIDGIALDRVALTYGSGLYWGLR